MGNSAGDVAASAGAGIPEPLNVLLRQRHRRIEADDREVHRDVLDLLIHHLPGLRVEEIELGGVVPGHRCSIVAVEDIVGLTGIEVSSLERDRCVAAVVVVVFQLDLNVGIGGEIRSVERVGGEGRMSLPDEEVGVAHHPVAVDARVVGDHVAGKADSILGTGMAKGIQSAPSSDEGSDLVVPQGVCRSFGIGVACKVLDHLAGT